MVAICALQKFVMNTRTNSQAITEAGDSGTAAVSKRRSCCTSHTLQEYVSNELISYIIIVHIDSVPCFTLMHTFRATTFVMSHSSLIMSVLFISSLWFDGLNRNSFNCTFFPV